MVSINLSVTFHDILLVQASRPLSYEDSNVSELLPHLQLYGLLIIAQHTRCPTYNMTRAVSSDKMLLSAGLRGPAGLEEG